MAFENPTMGTAQTAQAGLATVDLNALSKPVGTTTSEQLSGILNQNGALMQQAATMGNQQSNARGLLNSSMGIQAAQGAVLSAATPIAQADASAINQNQQFGASAINTSIGQNTQAANAANQFNTQQTNAQSQWNTGQQNEAVLKTMDLNSREQLANIESNYRQLMQTSSSASALYEQHIKTIGDIQQNKDLTADSKTAAIANQMTYLKSGMQMLQNLGGVTGLVTF
jgi:hypothetical protein